MKSYLNEIEDIVNTLKRLNPNQKISDLEIDWMVVDGSTKPVIRVTFARNQFADEIIAGECR